MSWIALLVVSVVGGWVATLALQHDPDRVALLDVVIGVGGAALTGALLGPALGVSLTGDYGLTLSGTAAACGGASALLAAVNLVRHRRLRSGRCASRACFIQSLSGWIRVDRPG